MTDSSVPARPAVALPLLLLLGTNWGLGFSLAKFGQLGGISPLGYVFWQCAGSGAVLLVLCLLRRHLPPLSGRHLRYYLLMGSLGIALPALNLVFVVGRIPVGVMTLVMTLAPLMTYGVAQIAGSERFDLRRTAGMLIGFGGALLIVLPETSLPSPDMAPWVLMAIITPALYAATNVYAGMARPQGVDSLALASAMQLSAGVSVAPFTLLSGNFHLPTETLTTADIALLTHIGVASLGSLLFFEIIRMAGVVFMSQVAYVVTMTGILWGMYFFNEQHSSWIWAALVVILTGLALVTRPPAKAAP